MLPNHRRTCHDEGMEANSYYRLSELVETISKKKIPGHQKNVIFEITAEDQSEEDVEIPYVMLKLRD